MAGRKERGRPWARCLPTEDRPHGPVLRDPTPTWPLRRMGVPGSSLRATPNRPYSTGPQLLNWTLRRAGLSARLWRFLRVRGQTLYLDGTTARTCQTSILFLCRANPTAYLALVATAQALT